MPLLIASCILQLAAGARAQAQAGSGDLTAVSSRVSGDYRRTILADGSFKPETYGFAIGGHLSHTARTTEAPPPTSTSDATIDGMPFAAIARDLEGPLKAEAYLPTPEPKTADLLIVVYWGRTIGTNAFGGSDVAQVVIGADRDKVNLWNARLLGFDSEQVFAEGFDDPANMMAQIRNNLHSGTIDAVEDDRYFIILQALDFQTLWKRKRVHVLWETRFSLSQRHHDFGKDLPMMARVAAPFFGQDSHGLVRRQVPLGRVDIGEVKSLGEVPEGEPSAAPAK